MPRRALVVLLTCLSVPAAAQTLAVAPGLWEVRTDAAGALAALLPPAMRDNLEKMPPDQRAALEKLLAANVRLSRQVCVTPAMLDRGLAAALRPGRRNNCTASPLGGSATEAAYAVSCAGSPGGSGTVTLRATDPHTVSGAADGTVTFKDGESQPLHLTGEAHWLGAACGGVKPAG